MSPAKRLWTPGDEEYREEPTQDDGLPPARWAVVLASALIGGAVVGFAFLLIIGARLAWG